MQNRTREGGGNVFGADGWQYNRGADGRGQGPAMHMVGGGKHFSRGLYIYKNRDRYRKTCFNFSAYNAVSSYII